MRAYFFGNMYLSSIQQGIQAAHATHDMFVAYRDRPGAASDFLWEWATNHKTMILLNGGYAETIQELVDFFMLDGNPYPWSDFREEEASLNGALTTVGIVLPEKIYLTAAAIRNEQRGNVSDGYDGGSRYIRDMIWDDGSYVVGPENTLGFTFTEPTELEFTKWEAQLMDRLNTFNMAS